MGHVYELPRFHWRREYSNTMFPHKPLFPCIRFIRIPKKYLVEAVPHKTSLCQIFKAYLFLRAYLAASFRHIRFPSSHHPKF